jgi:signal transduction histidine kinase
MQQRAQNMKGALDIKSVKEKGTTILLQAPLTKTSLN